VRCFCRSKLKIITGFEDNFWIALAIVTAFIVASALPAVAKVAPPVLAALAAGIIAVIVAGPGPQLSSMHFALVRPTIFVPGFSIPALLELVLPLTVTVIGIQQSPGVLGAGILRLQGAHQRAHPRVRRW
jgi:benzoate membrane transport protein